MFFLVSFHAYLGRKKAFLAKPFAMRILKNQQSKGKNEQENKVSTVSAFFFEFIKLMKMKTKKESSSSNGTNELEAGERGALSTHTPVQQVLATSSARVKKP